jgi:hypothetical protein
MRSEANPFDDGTSHPRRSPGGYLPLAAFIFGNIWLLAAVALFLGCKFARSDPYMVSFTSEGGWLYPGIYNAVNIFCIVVAVACFWFMAASRRTT